MSEAMGVLKRDYLPADLPSGFSNSTVWLIFAAFVFAVGYEKTGSAVASRSSS